MTTTARFRSMGVEEAAIVQKRTSRIRRDEECGPTIVHDKRGKNGSGSSP